MTTKDKARQLWMQYYNPLYITDSTMERHLLAVKCALIVVDEIESALTEYGKRSNELQNMDDEFRWWDEIRLEINKL